MFLRIICLEYNLPYVQSDFKCTPGLTISSTKELHAYTYLSNYHQPGSRYLFCRSKAPKNLYFQCGGVKRNFSMHLAA